MSTQTRDYTREWTVVRSVDGKTFSVYEKQKDGANKLTYEGDRENSSIFVDLLFGHGVPKLPDGIKAFDPKVDTLIAAENR